MKDQHPKGFKPQPSVEWYNIKQLAHTGMQALISSIFGTFHDKRELQAALNYARSADDDQKDIKYYPELKNEEEVWIDYIADLGDGFNATYTMADLMARDELVLGDHKTQTGQMIVMGGDQVYPTATREEYLNRFRGPYKYAFNGKKERLLFAIPGNHDWYDGLSNFLKLFCQQRKIGALLTRQRRSYFAIQLPHKVWLFGIDVQLNSDIDKSQLDYFKYEVLPHMEKGSHIILCTAVPSWVFKSQRKAGEEAYNNLDHFERYYAHHREKEISRIVTLAGDMHHYSRYTTAQGDHRLTAGGGGAFLHPTHNLATEVEGVMEGRTKSDQEDTTAKLESAYPPRKKSRAMAFRTFGFALKNFNFAFFMGLIFGLFGWLNYINLEAANVMSDATLTIWAMLEHMLGRSPGMLVLLLVVVLGLYAFSDTDPYNPRWPAGFYHLLGWGHGVFQAAIMLGSYWLLAKILPMIGWAEELYFGLGMFLSGLIIGSTVMGIYLFKANWIFGMHDNEAFSSLKWEGYKNFLRIHVTKDKVTIYPVGIEKTVPWKYNPAKDEFDPKQPPQPFLIEDPIEIPINQ